MRINRFKAVLLTVTAVGVLAGGLLAEDFTWTGADFTDSWKPDCNWHPLPICQDGEIYPDDPGDDATFPWNASGAWAVDLVTVSIGDLIIEGSVDFNVQDDPNLPFTLTVKRLKIEPTSAAIEITMGDGGVIEVE